MGAYDPDIKDWATDSDDSLLSMATAVGRTYTEQVHAHLAANRERGSDMPDPTPHEIIESDGRGYAERIRGSKSFSQRFADHAVEAVDPRFNPAAPLKEASNRILDIGKDLRLSGLVRSYEDDGVDMTSLQLPGETREAYGLRQQYRDIVERFPDADGQQILEVHAQEQAEDEALRTALVQDGSQEIYNAAFETVVTGRRGVSDPETIAQIAALAQEKDEAGVDPLIALIEAADEVLDRV